jgi:hypothetical protein
MTSNNTSQEQRQPQAPTSTSATITTIDFRCGEFFGVVSTPLSPEFSGGQIHAAHSRRDVHSAFRNVFVFISTLAGIIKFVGRSVEVVEYEALVAFDKMKLVSPSSHIFAHFAFKHYSNLARISFPLLFLVLFEQKLFCLSLSIGAT